ncbi:type II toxin-antitoxin system ParD family antitoxin [Nitrosomonas aestuarii]|uniref:type II toxin-antitoxin system ParD family antitoxin n=1 Tax=Nitrosomonas aestuarii TaxID=52441 RepID=UPI000B887ACA
MITESCSFLKLVGLIVKNFEERETKLEALRHALIEGEQSGTSDYSLQSILGELESED